MNKVKIMLVLIGISMVGGGVLAFKATTKGSQASYCFNADPMMNRCPHGIQNSSFPGGTLIKYTITNDHTKCSAPCLEGVACNSLGGLPNN